MSTAPNFQLSAQKQKLSKISNRDLNFGEIETGKNTFILNNYGVQERIKKLNEESNLVIISSKIFSSEIFCNHLQAIKI